MRTLVLAVKELTPDYFEGWKKRHHEASTSLVNREEKLSAIYEEIEMDMKLIGATAIEDKLQDGVSSCIANLMQADIKVWVLTGDKQGMMAVSEFIRGRACLNLLWFAF